MWLWDKGLCTGGEPEATSIQEEEEIRERKRETHLEALFHCLLLDNEDSSLSPGVSAIARGQGWERICLLQSPDTESYSIHPVKLNILAKYLSCLKNNLFLLMITEKGVLTTSH